MTPRISVIVPVHDVAGYVANCLASVLGQGFTDFELIVVDDGSTDGSGDLARAAVAGDPRARVVHRPNGGLSAARNTGLDLARGDLICFVDSDDLLAADYLGKLESALRDSGADWVACGIRFVPAKGGAGFAHSALHGHPSCDGLDSPVRYDLTDWCDVVRHFPSAWNKIYRRDLIGDIRFDEGLNYEDHAFFYRYACRTDHLVHLHLPLYCNTQGRPGQITADGSIRVFDQFAVLDILRAIIAGSHKTGGATALARVVTRLTFERSQVIADPGLRARFLVQSRAALGAMAPDAALGVPAFWMSLLQGRVPVSVVIPSDGNACALNDTLTALARRTLPEAELLVVADSPASAPGLAALVAQAAARLLIAPGVGDMTARVAAARNAGLAGARGETVVFLDAGDILPPEALVTWHNRLCRAGADLGFARFVMAPETGTGADAGHSGLHDRPGLAARPGVALESDSGFVPDPGDALFLHAHPSAKIFDTAFLRNNGLGFRAGPLSSWQMLFAAVARAGRVLYLPGPPPRLGNGPDTRRLWRTPVAAHDLVAAVDALAGACPAAAAPAVRARLLLRAIWEKLNFADFPDPDARTRFVSDAVAVWRQGQGAGGDITPDPYVGPYLRNLLGLPNLPED